jgi:hypothetical protein
LEGFFELVVGVGRLWGEDSLFSESVVPSKSVLRMVGESGKGETILCLRRPLSGERGCQGWFQGRNSKIVTLDLIDGEHVSRKTSVSQAIRLV